MILYVGVLFGQIYKSFQLLAQELRNEKGYRAENEENRDRDRDAQ